MNPMRRHDRQTDSQFALNVLKDCEYATLSTINEDITPYGVPISPVLLDGAVYFHGAPLGTKMENIAARPRVCLSCVGKTRLVPEHFTTEYESAVITGKAQIVTDDEERLRALRAICEKYAPSHLHRFEEVAAKSLEGTCICKISVEEITGKARKMPQSD